MRTILNVSDDRGTADWVKIVLKGLPLRCRVRTVSSGMDALRLLSQHSYDLCIAEYALEDITGVQLCERIRSRGITVPVLIFSAMDRPIDRDRAFAAGANEYIAKPQDLGLFPDTVRCLLNIRPHQTRRFISHEKVVLAA